MSEEEGCKVESGKWKVNYLLRRDDVKIFDRIMDDRIIFFDAVGNASVFPAGVR